MSTYSQNHELRGIVLTTLSGILFGLLGLLGTHILRANFSIPMMLCWRFFIAAIWMLLFAFITKHSIFRINCSRDELIKTAIFIIISYSANSALYFVASQYIGTGMAMTIFYSFPIFVALFAWMLTDWRLNRYVFISLFAVMTGLILLKGSGIKSLSWIGIGIAVAAAISYAVYVYRSEYHTKQMSPALLTLIVCLGNSVVFFLISYFTHTLAMPTSFNLWLNVLAVGIIATALPIQLLLAGLQYLSPVKASILSVLEPIVTVVVGVMLLNETISQLQTAGIIIILFGAIIIQFDGKPDQGNILH